MPLLPDANPLHQVPTIALAYFHFSHEDAAIGAQFDDLVSLTDFDSRRSASLACRRALRNPQVAFVIHEETVWPAEESLAKALLKLAFEVQFENRVDVNTGTVVAATPAHQPDVLAVGILVYPGHDTEVSPGGSFAQPWQAR